MNQNGLYVRKIPDGEPMFIPGDVSITFRPGDDSRPVAADLPVIPTWINPMWTIPPDVLDVSQWLVFAPGSRRNGKAAERESEPEPRSPMPQPSSKVPFWAADVNKSRRPRKKHGQPNSQGIA